MIGKTTILQNLNKIERLYNGSTDAKESLLYSKLAILELCGWIEESMDDIVKRYANRHLRNKKNKKFVEKEIIQHVYGFEYKRHFRTMLIQIAGLITVEKIERRVDPVKLQLMQTTLNSLKTTRNNEAHSHLKGITKRLDAPSVTKSNFVKVYDGLKNFEDELKLL